MHYFNMSGREMTVEPKFIFFSAHAETVAPMVRFYDFVDEVPLTPNPAVMVIFDFVESYG